MPLGRKKRGGVHKQIISKRKYEHRAKIDSIKERSEGRGLGEFNKLTASTRASTPSTDLVSLIIHTSATAKAATVSAASPHHRAPKVASASVHIPPFVLLVPVVARSADSREEEKLDKEAEPRALAIGCAGEKRRFVSLFALGRQNGRVRRDGYDAGSKGRLESENGYSSVRKAVTHSWLSETSPVIAENPRKGAERRLIFSLRKQSVHSSPKISKMY